MKMYTRLLAFLALTGAACADDIEFQFVNLPLSFVTEQFSAMTGKVVKVKDEDLSRRYLSLHSPRKLTKSEATDFFRAILAVEGIAWMEVDGTIVLKRYLTDDQVKALKKSMGIPDPKVSYGKKGVRRVVLPPR